MLLSRPAPGRSRWTGAASSRCGFTWSSTTTWLYGRPRRAFSRTLHLQGTVTRPVVLGTVETQDGRVTFRRNRSPSRTRSCASTIRAGSTPSLDVRATTPDQTYDVTMWLSGRVEEPDDPSVVRAPAAAGGSAGPGHAGLDAGRARELRRPDVCRRGRPARCRASCSGLEPSAPMVDVLEFGKTTSGQNQFRVGKRLGDKTTVIYSGSFAEGGQRSCGSSTRSSARCCWRASSPSPGGSAAM